MAKKIFMPAYKLVNQYFLTLSVKFDVLVESASSGRWGNWFFSLIEAKTDQGLGALFY